MEQDSANDNPMSQWPEEIKKAYEQMPVPSLYDFILANEKLSLEIRRQDKDVKSVVEGLKLVSSQLNTILRIFNEDVEVVEIEDEDEDDEDFDEESQFKANELADLALGLLEEQEGNMSKNVLHFLTETTDVLIELSKTTKQLTGQLINLLPKEKFTSPTIPAWHKLSEEMCQLILNHVDDARYKMMMRLESWGVQTIEPQVGELFNSSKHRALEYVTGGPSETIARVVRLGYRQGDVVLRSADVVVYH